MHACSEHEETNRMPDVEIQIALSVLIDVFNTPTIK